MQSKLNAGRLTKSVLIGSTAMMMGMAVAGAANAQAQGGSQVSEVVVTGSRIVRKDFTSNSPVVTVSPQRFENTSNIAIENALNRLPQFTPAQNMTGVANSGDVQPTATNSIGISTVALRGLGANRNLVLADGKRLMPANGLMVIDVNTIPTAAVERVEIYTGGASAVYGPDAVGGVVNFIMKKNFQGLDFDSQYSFTQAGDGQEFKVSGLIGANFADDKGNAMFGLEHYTREAALQKNRDFYTKGWSDPSVPSNDFFYHGYAYKSDIFNNDPSQAAVSAAIPCGGPVVALIGPTYWFNSDGSVYTGANTAGPTFPGGSCAYKGAITGSDIALYNYVDSFNGNKVTPGLKSNQTNYQVVAPTDRWSLYGSAHYDLNDNISFYTKGQYVQNSTHTILFPTPFITGWGVQLPYDAATGGVASQHAVPTQLAALLNSRPNPNADWQLFSIPDPNSWMPPRSTRDTNTNWEVMTGFEGSIPGTQFTYDVYGSHGESTAYSLGEGYASLVRYRALLLAPNYGQNATITGNQVPPNFGFGAATIHCTSGFADTIFHGGTPSQDCIDAISAKIQNTTAMKQNIVEGTVQGQLFELPAGSVGISLGASYREEFLTYTPDVLQSVVSFADQVAGVYPTAYMDSSWNAREGFGELAIPLVKDVSFIKSLDLELGARYGSYQGHDRLSGANANIPSGWTYKILGSWAVNDWLRFRGGYNLAVRAPNLGELFTGKQQVFAGGAFTQYGNPCSKGTLAPYGANPATNSGGAAGAANVVAICSALMTPTGAANFYGNPTLQVPGTPTGFVFTFQEGNPNLHSEKAKTWTAGAVISSPWQSPGLSRLKLSVDWYKITIEDAIQFESIDAVRQACFSQPFATAITSAACSKVSYNPGTGNEAPTTIQFANLAHIDTAGIDGELDWAMDLGDAGLGAPGAIDAQVLISYLDHFNTIGGPGQAERHWAGTLGPVLSGFNPGAYRWKSNVTVGYTNGPAHVSVNWRHLPGIHQQGFGLAGDNSIDVHSHDEVGLYGTFNFMSRYTLRAGVDNLFNVDPEITGANTGNAATVPNSGQGTTNEGLYDAVGRRFYVGLKARF